MAAIKVEKSRFAALKIDDDYSSDEDKPKSSAGGAKQKQGAAANSQAASKKKIKPAKKPSSASSAGDDTSKRTKKLPPVVADKQWDEWSKLDEKYIEGAYERELQEAIATSKIQYEEMKQNRAAAAVHENGTGPSGGGAAGKKKGKKKEKAVVMSLEQFSQATLDKKPPQRSSRDSDDSDDEHLSKSAAAPPPIVTSIPAGQSDTKFFDRLDNDVQDILVREKRQKEFKKHCETDNVQTSKLRADLELKDKEIVMLRATTKKLEEELAQVKKRNQQLCHILGQGEMKDKTALLLEADELRQVRDDLTQEVTRLTSDLEKERSKVHGLKGDIDKAKAGKHSGK